MGALSLVAVFSNTDWVSVIISLITIGVFSLMIPAFSDAIVARVLPSKAI